MVGFSRIYQVSLRLSEDFLQGMESLMFFSMLSIIRHLCTLWKGNIVLFKDFFQLVDGLIHALTLWMKASHIVWTLSLLEILLFLETQGSIGFKSKFLVSFPLCFPFACPLFESVTKSASFLVV